MSRWVSLGVVFASCVGGVSELPDGGRSGGSAGGASLGGGSSAGGDAAGGSSGGLSGGGVSGGLGGSGGGGTSGGTSGGGSSGGASAGGTALPNFDDRCAKPAAPALPTPLRTLFVDGDLGSDSNAGTSQGAAWKTLAKVNGAAMPGDLVWVSGGFDGGYLRPASGTAQNPIVFRVPSGKRATISNAQYGTALWIAGRSYLVFDGFELTGNTQPVDFLNVDHVWVRNSHISRSGYARMIDSNDNRFEDNDWPDCADWCLFFANGSNRNVVTGNRLGRANSVQLHFAGTTASPNGANEVSFNRLENPIGSQLSLAGISTGTIVRCNEFAGAGSAFTDGGLPGPSLTISSSNNLIESNVFARNAGEAIRLQSIAGFQVIGNRLSHNTQVGNGGPAVRMLWSEAAAVIDDNEIVDNLMWANNTSSDFHWTANGEPFEVVADFYHKGVNGYPDGGIGLNRIHHNVIATSDGDLDGGWFYVIGYSQNRLLSRTAAEQRWPGVVYANLEVNPRLVDLDAGLFMLHAGSPAIDRGAPADAGVFVGAAPDPGRFEWRP